MDKENGCAQRKWGLLRNRYSKKRFTIRSKNECIRRENIPCRNCKKEYMFLGWLYMFIRPKNSKSNVINSLATNFAINEATKHESRMHILHYQKAERTDSSAELSIQKKTDCKP